MIAGRYALEREIGRGGMGSVWLARDEVLGRVVALKRIGLLPGADGTDVARAEREARLAARLSHPHVVAVIDLVVDADEQWLVMEYVDGSTLAQLVRAEGPLPHDEAARILGEAADALVAAHAAGIVHRDVKPSNILVDSARRVKLTDFGIARTVADPSLTVTGLVTGSPAYLAPEVASGRRGDEAADVWSLGATMFHVLAGRPPYDIGDQVVAGLYRIVHEEPPRLDGAGWLAPLLESTMVRDPARRWSMEQVRDFLVGSGRGEAPTRTIAPVAPAPVAPAPDPVPVPAQAPEPAPRAERVAPAPSAGRGGRRALVPLALLVLVAAAAWGLSTLLGGGDDGSTTAGGSSPSTTPSVSRSPSASRSPTTANPATAQGMESFVRGYVDAVSSDPAIAWTMLTPKFQRESGGLATYTKFWSGVGDGTVLSMAADPDSLVVRYRVRFENFGTGRRPTVLQLVLDQGRYLIDGELTAGSG